MKLGFDIDDVVTNCLDVITDYIFNNYNVYLKPKVFKEHSLTIKYTDNAELNKEITIDILDKCKEPEFLSKAKPKKNSVEVLNSLKYNKGHSLHFVTARPVDALNKTVEYFELNNIPFDSIHTVGFKKSKTNCLSTLNLDMYVDDLESNLHDAMLAKSRYKKGLILYNSPWNISYNKMLYGKVYNWEDIYKHVGG